MAVGPGYLLWKPFDSYADCRTQQSWHPPGGEKLWTLFRIIGVSVYAFSYAFSALTLLVGR